jgi:hypothetical protein
MRPRPLLLLVALLAMAATLTPAPAGARPAKAPRRAKAAATDTLAAKRQVIAYYFHGKARCANCIKIETWSREAVESAYAKELADGRLVWRVVDVEAEGNEHFVEDYQLYTKSLVLVDLSRGKQTRWKNCARVWEHLNSKERFLGYVRDEVAAYLKGTP